MNICVIGTNETVMGFGLCGVKRAYEVKTKEEAFAAYQKDDAKIVIIDEPLAEVIDQKRKDDRILVRVGTDMKGLMLKKLIKDTIGFEVKI